MAGLGANNVPRTNMRTVACFAHSCGTDERAGLDSANMAQTGSAAGGEVDRTILVGIAAVSAALLMTELALTRIFSVTMYYHFAFLAISIALFGLSASGVFVYVMRRRLAARDTGELLCAAALAHMTATIAALACL